MTRRAVCPGASHRTRASLDGAGRRPPRHCRRRRPAAPRGRFGRTPGPARVARPAGRRCARGHRRGGQTGPCRSGPQRRAACPGRGGARRPRLGQALRRQARLRAAPAPLGDGEEDSSGRRAAGTSPEATSGSRGSSAASPLAFVRSKGRQSRPARHEKPLDTLHGSAGARTRDEPALPSGAGAGGTPVSARAPGGCAGRPRGDRTRSRSRS